METDVNASKDQNQNPGQNPQREQPQKEQQQNQKRPEQQGESVEKKPGSQNTGRGRPESPNPIDA
jgi:hypothetical protein